MRGGNAACPIDPAMERLIETLVRRDRLAVSVALAGIGGVAWFYLIYETERFAATGICHCAAMAIGGPNLEAWAPQTLLPLSLMWIEMMLAMMLPAVAPLVLLFSKVARSRTERGEPFIPTIFFVSGYFAVWSVFSFGAAIAQWTLHGVALLSPQMAAKSSILCGLLFVSAGLFQFLPLKNLCLSHCRSPLAFLLTEWRDGPSGAFRMGWRHGLFCTACCWLLMLLLFAVGIMNLLWIALLAIFALSERITPRHWRLAQVSGVVLAALGVWMLFGSPPIGG
jgi:predicted metal-binding membrane protein